MGAIQLKAGLAKEAVTTYQEDLERLPKNGWTLKGLSLAYAALDDPKWDETEALFQKAWANADVELMSSVID